jgi:hypothetical protein
MNSVSSSVYGFFYWWLPPAKKLLLWVIPLCLVLFWAILGCIKFFIECLNQFRYWTIKCFSLRINMFFFIKSLGL